MEWTFETAAEAFEALLALKSEVNRLTRRISLMETRCSLLTARYGPQAGGGNGKRLSDVWDELIEERERLARQLQLLLAAERKIDLCISHIPNHIWRQVLRYRYIDGLRFSQIGLALEKDAGRWYCDAQIYRIHKSAMAVAEKIWAGGMAG